jgi:hypothetical protein
MIINLVNNLRYAKLICNYQHTLARILEIIIKKAPRVKLRNEVK